MDTATISPQNLPISRAFRDQCMQDGARRMIIRQMQMVSGRRKIRQFIVRVSDSAQRRVLPLEAAPIRVIQAVEAVPVEVPVVAVVQVEAPTVAQIVVLTTMARIMAIMVLIPATMDQMRIQALRTNRARQILRTNRISQTNQILQISRIPRIRRSTSTC